MKITKEVFTPERCKAEIEEQEKRIAEGGYNQRSLSKSTVRKYANTMRHGHWHEDSPNGLVYDEAGNLINGRHRIHACAMAGVPITFVVFRGIKSIQRNGIMVNPQDTIDNGRVRSIAAQLQIDGVKCAVIKASIARSIALMGTTQHNKLDIITARTILEMYDRHINAVMDGLHHNVKRMRGHFVATLAMYRDKERAKADAFVESFHDRTNLSQNSPVLALIRFQESHAHYAGTDSLVASLRATALALYHYHQGGTVNTLRSGSEIGREWLLDLCRGQVRKVREILGEDQSEEALAPISGEPAGN